MRQREQIQENRAFAEMLRTARAWLADRSPLDIAEKTGIVYEEEQNVFCLNSLGMEIRIQYPDYRMIPDVEEWHQLVILHYMKLADGAPLSGNWMTIGDLKDGLIRGGDFDNRRSKGWPDPGR